MNNTWLFLYHLSWLILLIWLIYSFAWIGLLIFLVLFGIAVLAVG